MTDMIIEDNGWVQTHAGVRFNFLNIKEDMINIEDISHALSNICRYNGHTKEFFSVAEHSYLLAEYVWETTSDKKKALETLLHDAAEAYLCDIPRPIKYSLPDYRAIEKKLETIINKKYNLEFPMSDWLKVLDSRMLCTEKQQVLAINNIPWVCDSLEVLPIKVEFDIPIIAKKLFLNSFLRFV